MVVLVVELLVLRELLELLEELLELPRQVDLARARDLGVDVKPSCWLWKSCLNLRSQGSGSNLPFASFRSPTSPQNESSSENETLFHA